MASHRIWQRVVASVACVAFPALATGQESTPRLLNTAEVVDSLRAAYPADLRALGVSATVRLYLSLDASGRVTKSYVLHTSHFRDMDEAALRVADIMRFQPGVGADGESVREIAMPIRFRLPLPAGVVDSVTHRATFREMGEGEHDAMAVCAKAGTSGRATADIVIDTSGRIVWFSLRETDSSSVFAERMFLELVTGLRYHPATNAEGEPVAARAIQTFSCAIGD